VRQQIAHLRPAYIGRRFLFSGRELGDSENDKTLSTLRALFF
jgi:hypothetical protein